MALISATMILIFRSSEARLCKAEYHRHIAGSTVGPKCPVRGANPCRRDQTTR